MSDEKTISNYDDLRAQIREIMALECKSYADIASESGIPKGTITPWMNNQYGGRQEAIAEKLQKWLNSRAQKSALIMPNKLEFQETPTALAIMDQLIDAHMTPDICVISGGAGIGKTSALEEYQRRYSNVWIVTMDRSSTRLHAALVRICEGMGIAAYYTNSASHMVRNILQFTKNISQGLLIIDEAQHLEIKALDQIRAIYDQAKDKIGIAVVGNDLVADHMEGASRQAEFAQLFSRIGARHTQRNSRPSDALCLLDAWEINGDAERTYLKGVALKEGGLRVMSKVVRRATILAAGKEESLAKKHFEAAYRHLTGKVETTKAA